MLKIFKTMQENKNLKKKIAIMQSELDFKDYMINASHSINSYLLKKIETITGQSYNRF